MSVIVELRLPADAFELGQILRVEGDTRITLETLVPLGDGPVPFVRVTSDTPTSFESTVRDHEAVRGFSTVMTTGGETLYALDWIPSAGTLFAALIEGDVTLLGGSGGPDEWALELRFPGHEHLSAFRSEVLDDYRVTVERIYRPTDPDGRQQYGLTDSQRDTLLFAVEEGYYSLPRGISTKELAEEFDISDQAATERLRRGISTLVESTLAATDGQE